VSESPKVLLVEDDLFHRELLAEGLRDYYSYDVVVAENLQRAEDKLQEMTPDLIVLDCVVGGNRFEAMDWAEQLRSRPAFLKTPILFVTAFYNEMEDRAKGIKHSAILAKPFNFEDVTHRMRGLLAAKG
jgi:DNA-binding response OmpR family regulator